MSTTSPTLLTLPNELLSDVAKYLAYSRPAIIPETQPTQGTRYKKELRSDLSCFGQTNKLLRAVVHGSELPSRPKVFFVTAESIRTALEYTDDFSNADIVSELEFWKEEEFYVDAWKASAANSAEIWVQPHFLFEDTYTYAERDARLEMEIIGGLYSFISHLSKLESQSGVCPRLKHIVLSDQGLGVPYVVDPSHPPERLIPLHPLDESDIRGDTEGILQAAIHDIAQCRQAEVHWIDMYSKSPIYAEYHPSLQERLLSIDHLAPHYSVYSRNITPSLIDCPPRKRAAEHAVSFRLYLHPSARELPIGEVIGATPEVLARHWPTAPFLEGSDITIYVPPGERFDALRTAVESSVEEASLVTKMRAVGVSFQVKDGPFPLDVKGKDEVGTGQLITPSE